MPDWNGEAWCSLHKCHPTECFDIHHPEANEGGGESAEQMQRRIEQEHRRKQRVHHQ